jgi:CheY-like chemotaxis protein
LRKVASEIQRERTKPVIRALVADENPEIRKAIARILRGLKGVEFGGAAGSMGQLLALWERVRADLVVVDLRLVSLDGFSGLRRLRSAPGLRIMLLTIYDGAELRAVAANGMADASVCKWRIDREMGGEIARLFPSRN